MQTNGRHERMHLTLKKQATKPAAANFLQQQARFEPHLSGQQKNQFQQIFAGQAVGIKEVHDDIWLVSFMDYDLGYFDFGYFDLARVLEPLENPFSPKVSFYFNLETNARISRSMSSSLDRYT